MATFTKQLKRQVGNGEIYDSGDIYDDGEQYGGVGDETGWTEQTKNSSSWTKRVRNGVLVAGMPIGLLLALTYATASSPNIWSLQTKN